MSKAVSDKFGNSITRGVCELFISLCPTCQGHRRAVRPKPGFSPLETSGFGTRGQVDLIDLQSIADGPYKWLLVYQDHGIKVSRGWPSHSRVLHIALEMPRTNMLRDHSYAPHGPLGV